MRERERELSRAIAELEGVCVKVAREFYLPGGDFEDVLQEARIGAWEGLRDYRADRGASLRTFCRLAIRRQVMTAVKTATRAKRYAERAPLSLQGPLGGEGEEGTLADVIPLHDDPLERLIARERLNDLVDGLGRRFGELSWLEAEAIRLHLAGFSYAEIASELGEPTGELLSRKTIDNALQRARRKLDVGEQAA